MRHANEKSKRKKNNSVRLLREDCGADLSNFGCLMMESDGKTANAMYRG